MSTIEHRIAPNLPKPPRAARKPCLPRAIFVDGKPFASLAAAAEHYGVKRQTVHWWINRKKSPRGRYA